MVVRSGEQEGMKPAAQVVRKRAHRIVAAAFLIGLLSGVGGGVAHAYLVSTSTQNFWSMSGMSNRCWQGKSQANGAGSTAWASGTGYTKTNASCASLSAVPAGYIRTGATLYRAGTVCASGTGTYNSSSASSRSFTVYGVCGNGDYRGKGTVYGYDSSTGDYEYASTTLTPVSPRP